MATENKKPIHKIRVRNVQAAIWEQIFGKGTFLTVTFSRSYKDKSDQWHNGLSY